MTIRPPFETAEILVYPHCFQGPPRRPRKLRNDDRSVSDQGNHRVSPVDLALTDMSPWMRVHVSDDFDLLRSAVLPQGSIPIGVEGDRPGLVGIGIEIVIANECCDATTQTAPMA